MFFLCLMIVFAGIILEDTGIILLALIVGACTIQ